MSRKQECASGAFPGECSKRRRRSKEKTGTAKQTDEGAGLGQVSFRRHLIRPFRATFPSRGDSPLCGVSPRKKYACGIFQGEWDNRRRQTTIKMASEADKRAGRLSSTALSNWPFSSVLRRDIGADLFQVVLAAHVGTQGLGDDDAAVGLEVVLQEGDEHTGRRHARCCSGCGPARCRSW